LKVARAAAAPDARYSAILGLPAASPPATAGHLLDPGRPSRGAPADTGRRWLPCQARRGGTTS